MVWLYGIDTAAHIGTLEENGKTIAVLGCGFDNIFPKENIKLFHEIIEKGGLVISEYPPETKPDSKKFLERNRIVSGLSIGILVIEAAHRSGTSVTCKLAREQNKKIFCLPHNLEDIHGVGTNRLLKKGAYIVTSANDIIEKYKYLNRKRPEEEILKQKIEIDEKYIEIYNSLIGPPLNVTQICNKLNKSPTEVNNALLMLELDGIIVRNKYGYQVNLKYQI